MSRMRFTEALREVLHQGLLLLDGIEDAVYLSPVASAFQATIGSHYRHCLDHYECLFEGISTGVIDYDARKRDSLMEASRAIARARTVEFLGICRQLEDLGYGLSDRILVRTSVSYCMSESSVEVVSSFEREAVYVVMHAIHHYALIGVLCASQRVVVPDGFGIAPSTLKYRAAVQAQELSALKSS